MNVIGIAGRAGAGKTTAAKIIIKQFPKFKMAAFADPLKDMLEVGLGLSRAQLSDPALKGVVDQRYQKTPRELMQTLGTEWGRNMVGWDIWETAMAVRLAEEGSLVIHDVRFENEASFIRKHGLLIHIVGRGGIAGGHVSEKGIEIRPEDAEVENTGDLECLRLALTLIMGYGRR